MPDETTSGLEPSSTTISDLLRNITAQEDLDSCSIMANVINVYLDAIKRRGARTELFADDISRILTITRAMLMAGDVEQGIAQLVNRRQPVSLKGKPEVVR